MGILSGVVSYLFGLALNLLDAAINGFLGALGFDLDTFETYFPAAADYYDVIIGFAVGLLFIMLVFQLFRNFGIVLDIEAEDPLKMLGKTALFYGMIINSRSIANIVIGLLADPYAIFMNAASEPYEFNLLEIVTSMFMSVFSTPFMAVVALVLMLVLGWQFLKLTIECTERYIVFCFVLYCAPVVYATGAFKSTAQIFKSWCRMLASQALLLLLNIWSIKLFLSFLPVLESDQFNIVLNFLIGYAFLKFAQKADSLLRILGLNTASTGDIVRSLGGTVAGIALTMRSMSSMAATVASAAGKGFGKDAVGAAGSAAGRAAGNVVSGMAGAPGSAPRGAGSPTSDSGGGSVAGSGMSAAKQGYVSDVLSAAKSQMGGRKKENGGADGSQAQSYPYMEDSSGGLWANSGGKAGANSDSLSGIDDKRDGEGVTLGGERGEISALSQVDAETREGLANIARGLPHDKHDPIKNTFSGGGFPEFTGEKANLIGASQLIPAEGFGQHGVKMRDGSVGTLYQNSETGEAHLVQFGSVDNGVIQGTISAVDPKTGKMGDFMAFKAVHQSVPGAEGFSGHSVAVADGSGGAYHLSTGADTSFFAPGGSSTIGAAGSAGSADKAPKVGAPNSGDGAFTPNPPAGGMGEALAGHTSVSSHETGTIHTSSIVGSTPSGSAPAPGMPPVMPESGGSAHPISDTHGNRSGESPPVSTGMRHPPENAGRFSRSNPANMEVFRREMGGAQSFDRASVSSDTVTKMGNPNERG